MSKKRRRPNYARINQIERELGFELTPYPDSFSAPHPRRKRRPLLKTVAVTVAIVAAASSSVIYLSSNNVQTPQTASTYVGQASAGSGDGSSCANQHSAAYFNSAGNWGGGNTYAPGTTVGLCGTITSTLTVQGSGTNGNPITLEFQPGAKISQPYCNTTVGCLNIDGQSYITVDGNNTGVIESNDNGTALGNQQAAMGIYLHATSNIIVDHLTIRNLYIHSSPSDAALSSISQYAIEDYNGNANTFGPGLTIHDTQVGIYWRNSGTGFMINTRAYGNDLYNIDHPFTPTFNYPDGAAGPWQIDHNHIHDFSNWDTTTNAYHHDGIHCYTSDSGAGAANMTAYIFDNDFYNITGANVTSPVFIEGGAGTPCATSTSPLYVFNNIVDGVEHGSGILGIFSGLPHVYNNTIIAEGTGNTAFGANQPGTTGATTFLNNAVKAGNPMVLITSGFASNSPDYNVYGEGTDSGNGGWQCNGNTYNFTNQFAVWQACAAQAGDAHSSTTANIKLNADGSPQGGSPVLGAGTNLTSLCVGALAPLCQDYNGAARPAMGAWDVGAIN